MYNMAIYVQLTADATAKRTAVAVPRFLLLNVDEISCKLKGCKSV